MTQNTDPAALAREMLEEHAYLTSKTERALARAVLALTEERDRMREALLLMVQTYPYSPPCHDWGRQVDAHRAANAALRGKEGT